ncbi:MAG: endonuclease domain-containing protein [Spirochaetales bacterium]|nr:endonuclease domain-containing protein [Spirochaetales bacterium]
MIRILDIDPTKDGKYSVNISIGDWCLQRIVTDSDLQLLSDEINEARGLSGIMATFSCSEDEANRIRRHWGFPGFKGSSDCQNCQLKGVECYKCLFVCQSPLEQDMFKEFRRRGIEVVLQRRIRKDGTYYDAPEEVDKETILTIPDFYIESGESKLCIYADGKTYHYTNEDQGVRDRSIDIALQNLGYKVLRYTGTQIRGNVSSVIDSVMKSI